MYTLSARGVVCIRRRRGVWCVYIVSEGCGVYTLSARGVVCIHCQRGVWCVDIVSEGCGVCTQFKSQLKTFLFAQAFL